MAHELVTSLYSVVTLLYEVVLLLLFLFLSFFISAFSTSPQKMVPSGTITLLMAAVSTEDRQLVDRNISAG